MLIREGHYFKVLLCDNFWQFDESQGNYTSKTCQVETKPVCTHETFFSKTLIDKIELTI